VAAEWLARGRRPPAKARGGDGGLLVKELILGYHSHLAETSPDLVDKVVQALRAVREMYGETEAAKFGPVAFKAIRLKMMEADLAITTIRDRMGENSWRVSGGGRTSSSGPATTTSGTVISTNNTKKGLSSRPSSPRSIAIRRGSTSTKRTMIAGSTRHTRPWIATPSATD
jgi:hypothetical protein